jgi:hypothetical protein
MLRVSCFTTRSGEESFGCERPPSPLHYPSIAGTHRDVLPGLTPEGPTVARVTLVAVRSGRFRWLTLVLLTAWVILGPVGMAFDSCAAMMALCDGGPCGAVSGCDRRRAPLAHRRPDSCQVSRSKQFTPVPRSALEPPPKFVRLSP